MNQKLTTMVQVTSSESGVTLKTADKSLTYDSILFEPLKIHVEIFFQSETIQISTDFE